MISSNVNVRIFSSNFLCQKASGIFIKYYSRMISLEVALKKQAVLELDFADVLGLGQRVGVRVEEQDQHHHQHKVAVELKSKR